MVLYTCTEPYTKPILRLNDGSIPTTTAGQVLRVGCYNYNLQRDWRFLDVTSGDPQVIAALTCQLTGCPCNTTLPTISTSCADFGFVSLQNCEDQNRIRLTGTCTNTGGWVVNTAKAQSNCDAWTLTCASGSLAVVLAPSQQNTNKDHVTIVCKNSDWYWLQDDANANNILTLATCYSSSSG